MWCRPLSDTLLLPGGASLMGSCVQWRFIIAHVDSKLPLVVILWALTDGIVEFLSGVRLRFRGLWILQVPVGLPKMGERSPSYLPP